jgi:hypothetical protein
MKHFIKQLNRLIPQVNDPIMQAQIRDDGGRFRITAVSMRTESAR